MTDLEQHFLKPHRVPRALQHQVGPWGWAAGCLFRLAVRGERRGGESGHVSGRGTVGGGERARWDGPAGPRWPSGRDRRQASETRLDPSPDGLNASGRGQNHAHPDVIHFCSFRQFSSFIIFKVCMHVHAKSLQSCLFVTLRTVAHQAPLSMGFSRRESWSGLPCPPPGDLPNPGIKLMSLTFPALVGRFFTTSAFPDGSVKNPPVMWETEV